VIALAVSALVAAYLLVPYAIFRFLLGRFVPLRVLQDRKTEDLTRAVVTLLVVYLIALLLVWVVPGCRNHPFAFPDNAEQRVSDYQIVAGGLYSETVFRDYGGRFWDAFWRTTERQGRFICWYYLMVVTLAVVSGVAIQRYGAWRRYPPYAWLADVYLLPHISQWWVLLTPFAFSDRRTLVRADVLMTDNTLYSGEVADHFLDREGNLSGLFLANPQRFDRRSYFREQDAWGSARGLESFWRPIPSAKLYLVADKIVNLNLNYEPPVVTSEVLTRYLSELQGRYGKGSARKGITVSITPPERNDLV